MNYEVTILWNRVHKFPKVPRQYFVTPVYDNQNFYDPPPGTAALS